MTEDALIGRQYRSSRSYEVSREKIREFAESLNDLNPAYRDVNAAQALGHADVIAPPTFSMVVSAQTVDKLLTDPFLEITYSHVVHGEQRFEFTRPIKAGDILDTVATIESERNVAGNRMITYRCDITAADEPVVVTRCLIVVRGDAA
jgi:acyl dehydratase